MSRTDYKLPMTDYSLLRGKRVTVMGLGLHGGALGTITWLHEQGAKITVTDLKTSEQLAASISKLKPFTDVQLVLGKHRDEDFSKADLVIRNPAVPKNSEYLKIAHSAGVPVAMDSSLFFQYSPSTDIIGVTGSKGKTTTATAIATVLKVHNPATVAVGIDGISPLGSLKQIQPNAPVVFELSSWRLEALGERSLSPNTAIVTSIYHEHLNTYETFEDYVDTKKMIWRYQRPDGITILNWDDPIIRTWSQDIYSKLYWYSLQTVPEADGICIENSAIRVRVAGKTWDLFSADALPYQADHERRNLLPAILIGVLKGMKQAGIERAIRKIGRLPHRLEPVRELDDVTYINDSTATMPDATIAALRSLAGKPLILILGGSDKRLQFAELAEEIGQADIRSLIWLPGTATERMQALIGPKTRAAQYWAQSMIEAVHKAHDEAKAGDTVLLSPGATGFGLFQHEFDRGEKFRSAVEQLA